MKQNTMDGILMDNKITVQDQKNESMPYLMRFLQYLAIITGSWSTITILTENFEISVLALQVNMAVMLSGIVFFVLILFSGYWKVKITVTGLVYGLLCWHYFSRLQNAFYILENLVIKQINGYYASGIIPYKADYKGAGADSLLLMIAIAVPVTALLAAAILRRWFHNVCTIILLLPIIACFAVGIVPDEKNMIGSVAVLLFMTKSCSRSRTTIGQKSTMQNRVHVKSAVWLTVIALGICFFIQLIFSPTEYEQITAIKDAKKRIQSYIISCTWGSHKKSMEGSVAGAVDTAVGGLGKGKLGEVARVKFTNTEHLRVIIPKVWGMKKLYLKAYVGCEYKGNHWEDNSEEAKGRYYELSKEFANSYSPVNQVGLLLKHIGSIKNKNSRKKQYKFYRGTVKVSYVDADKAFFYAPYFTDYGTVDRMEYLEDLCAVPAVKKSSYTFDCYFGCALENISKNFCRNLYSKIAGYSKYEKMYRSYVYDVYTRLPQNGLERLKRDFCVTGKNGKKRVYQKIDYIKEYLQNHTTYSLAPGSLPKGKDFVEYFLYENKVGYCSHYASAATLMLRCMGVPARYVEGYAVDNDTSSRITDVNLMRQSISRYTDRGETKHNVKQIELSVKDYNAHAWVEVYIDNCGWIPVDFTPGLDTTFRDAINMEMVGENINQYEKEHTKSKISAEPSSIPEAQTAAALNKNTEHARKTAGKVQAYRMFFVFAVFIAIMGMVFAGLGIRVYQSRKNMRITKNHNKRVLLLYARIEKFISLCHGLPMPGDSLEDHMSYVESKFPYMGKEQIKSCVEIAQRARFGDHMVDKEDVFRVEKYYKILYNNINRTFPLWKKIYLSIRLIFWDISFGKGVYSIREVFLSMRRKGHGG